MGKVLEKSLLPRASPRTLVGGSNLVVGWLEDSLAFLSTVAMFLVAVQDERQHASLLGFSQEYRKPSLCLFEKI